MGPLNDSAAVEAAVRQAVARTTISDIHTHLFPPSHGRLLLWGIDELLTYHYLVAELFTIAPRELSYKTFWSLSKVAQADLVWEHVFLRHGALSEAARGVITTLSALVMEMHTMLQRNELLNSFAYLMATMIGGFAFFYAGFILTRMLRA